MLNNTLGYIPDGMEVDGYIAEVPGLHVALKFKYRPTLPRTRARVAALQENTESDRGEELTAVHVAKHITEWNLRGIEVENGECPFVKVSADAILHSQPTLMIKLSLIVLGSRANEVEPDAEGDISPDTHAQLAGVTPDPDYHQSERLGNSEAESS